MKDNIRKQDPLQGPMFDLKDMSPEELRAMFMGVSVKSLDNWLQYAEKKDLPDICTLIKQIRHYKNGQAVVVED